MARIPLLIVAIAATLFAGMATASTHSVESFSDGHHSVWLPGLDQRHLHFDDGAIFTKDDDSWNLTGNLTSATDNSKWSIDVDFGGIISGKEFGSLTDFDDARIKGSNWSNARPDWSFADTVTGTIQAHTGDHAGRVFDLERMKGSNDYLGQFGTCMNDKNCEVGLSSWITLTDVQTDETYRGDINVNISNPVPEPSAALVFGLGTLIAGTATRYRKN